MAEFNKETFELLFNSVKKEDADTNFAGLSYVSWATAWKHLMMNDPDANYEIIEKPDGGIVWEEFGTLLVKTKVTAFGKTIKMHLPIMDSNHNPVKLEAYTYRNKPVPGINSRIVNDNIMRCLAKNIAMFGIGLALYTKEDLPSDDSVQRDADEARIKGAYVSRAKPEVATTLCTDCGEPIKGDGKLTADKIISGTTKTYGVPLCAGCGHKRKDAQKAELKEETKEENDEVPFPDVEDEGDKE